MDRESLVELLQTEGKRVLMGTLALGKRPQGEGGLMWEVVESVFFGSKYLGGLG